MVSQQSVVESGFRIAPYIRVTPTLQISARVHLKLEHLQQGGVFKTRGAYNVILRGLETGAIQAGSGAGIVIASGGNAALATAIAAQELGVTCYAFVPTTAPQAKLDKLSKAGAQVVSTGSTYQEAFNAASGFARDNGSFLSHAYDNTDVVDGAGTIGLEVLEQIPNVDTILVSCGGGGLYAGIAHAVGHKVNVIPVEPLNCATLTNALKFGPEHVTQVSGVASDSLGASQIGRIAYEIAARLGAQPINVPDNAIVAARRELWDQTRIVAEHGAAAAYAALSSGAYTPSATETVCVIVCGANTDLLDLGPRS